jgi:hypothetical protein
MACPPAPLPPRGCASAAGVRQPAADSDSESVRPDGGDSESTRDSDSESESPRSSIFSTMRRLTALIALLCLSLVRGDQSPVITAASFAPVTWSTDLPCPPDYPNAALGRACGAGATRLTLLGTNFDAARGGVDTAYISPPAPAPVPSDLPSVLQLSVLAPSSTNGCLPPSDAANSAFSIEVCPYSTSYLRARGGGPRVASLGVFSGVISDVLLNECDGQPPTAAVGLRFSGGDVCGSTGGTYSATVNFTCISDADPWRDRYEDNATVNAASVSPDGCTWALTVPLLSACPGTGALCDSALAPAPSPTPQPLPQWRADAYIAAWAPGAITLYAPPGPLPAPAALRVRAFDGAISAPRAPVAEPLPPSATPIPVPFPSVLTVLGALPSGGPSSDNADTAFALPCMPVTISLGGVLPSDLAGIDAGFDVVFPQSPGVSTQLEPLYGVPRGVAGGAPGRPAPNGRLDLQLLPPEACAPRLLQGFSTPFSATFTVRSRFRTALDNVTFVTRRTATCSGGACTWVFWGAGGPPAPPAAAAAAALSPAALYGLIGGGSALVLGLAGAAAYVLLRARGSCGGSAAGAAKAAAPALGARQEAWGAGTAVSLNPAALAAGEEGRASLAGGAAQPAAPAGVAEWGAKPV